MKYKIKFSGQYKEICPKLLPHCPMTFTLYSRRHIPLLKIPIWGRINQIDGRHKETQILLNALSKWVKKWNIADLDWAMDYGLYILKSWWNRPDNIGEISWLPGNSKIIWVRRLSKLMIDYWVPEEESEAAFDERVREKVKKHKQDALDKSRSEGWVKPEEKRNRSGSKFLHYDWFVYRHIGRKTWFEIAQIYRKLYNTDIHENTIRIAVLKIYKLLDLQPPLD